MYTTHRDRAFKLPVLSFRGILHCWILQTIHFALAQDIVNISMKWNPAGGNVSKRQHISRRRISVKRVCWGSIWRASSCMKMPVG
ncbi:hypothetical protein B0H34DRAFT_714606 [Crassisporium funariophilum]|nr:hypothetical protein B0H34DRAFT_714606 [Crassisporium funariophilum]